MGIKNFRSYAQTFFGQLCFKEFNINRVCNEVKDFSHHEVCCRATATLRASAGIRPIEYYDETYERIGLYIDLASLQYGCLLKSLEKNGRDARFSLSTDTEDDKVVVICELDSSAVTKIAAECAETLIVALRPLLTKAYRVYFAYDSCTPKAKRYEQAGRKRRANFSLAYATRVACYQNIVSAVKVAVTRAHQENLKRFLDEELGLDLELDVRMRAVESAVATQFPSDSVPFGEGEWKCFYRMHDDIDQRVVDTCFVFGRDWDIGFAMTMYQHPTTPGGFKYIYGPSDMLEHVKRFDVRERTLHFACLVLLGNDYVSRLVNPSDENLRLLKLEFDNMYENGGGMVTAHQVDYLSATLFGSDKQENDANDRETRVKISVAFATVFARLLSAVYTARPDEVENDMTRRPVVAATAQVLQLRRQLYAARTENTAGAATTPGTIRGVDGSAEEVLECKDSNGSLVPRTFQQCMDSFATTVLWYLSYTRFYFYSESGRQTFTGVKRSDDELRMLAGLRMDRENVFLYNDSRLSPNHRYDIRRLLEVRNVLRGMRPQLLFWILQYAFEHALESKLRM